MQRIIRILFLLFFIVSYCVFCRGVWENRKHVRDSAPAPYVIPSKFSRMLALGYKGPLSDFLFLKISTFIGGRNISGKQMADHDWAYVVSGLSVVTDLDPYFVDPYFLAEGLLAWEANKPEQANDLLIKGMESRKFDWRLPYFVGFNYFYFLKDYSKASEYIMQAASLSGSPNYLQTLAARLAYYGGRSKTALLFLKEMLLEARDPLLKQRLQLRLKALEGAVMIEEALDKYRRDQGKDPNKLSDLVLFQYLQALPEEPYGGHWVILRSGRVFSTSKFAAKLPVTK